MQILSLFGGFEAGRMALDKLGIVPTEYYSAEVDKYAIQNASHNYPDIIHIGWVTEVDGTQYRDIDWLIGWPPCQDLSIAGKRAWLQGERSGLFYEYVRILNEAKPKFFLVENVASMSKEAKEEITSNLFGIEPVLINSALVSAQNRKRLFWVGKRNADGTYSKVDVKQPEDKGLVLRDILEPIPLDDERWKPLPEKYVEAVKAKIEKFSNERKSFTIPATYAKVGVKNHLKSERDIVLAQFRRSDIRIHADQDNSPTLTANMGTGGNNVPIVIQEPYCLAGRAVNRRIGEDGKRKDEDKSIPLELKVEVNDDPTKSNTLTTFDKDNVVVAAPQYVSEFRWDEIRMKPDTEKTNSLTTNANATWNGSQVLVSPYDLIEEQELKEMAEDFENRNLKPIPESGYCWRKLTVRECARLQTFPEHYEFPVSASRAYKGIGNSWTADVIAHIFKYLI